MAENIILIDIVRDIIKASYTGGRYKGEEVSSLLNNKVSQLTPSSLLIVDFQKANPLDYVFCQYAFGPILKEIQENNKPTIFKMQPLHKRCFYRGVLKHIDRSLPRNTSLEESEKLFLGAELFTMIGTDGTATIDFIGKLDTEENVILKFINEKHSVSERDIIDEQKELQPTKIIDSLKSLNKKGFILNPKDGSDKYLSVCELLKSI